MYSGNSKNKKTILVIDSANIYSNGVYDWIANKVTSLEEPFLKNILKLQERFFPDMIVLLNDKDKSRYRMEINPEYKNNRVKAKEKAVKSKKAKEIQAEELRKKLKKNLHLFSETGLFINGEVRQVEADDVLGMLYNDERLKDYNIIGVTQDKDLMTVLPFDKIYDWSKERFKTLEDRHNLTQSQFLGFQALQGDSTDNIKGLEGVGEGTALKIINHFGSLGAFIRNEGQDIEHSCWRVKKANKMMQEPETLKSLKQSYLQVKIMKNTDLLNSYEKEDYERIVKDILCYNPLKEHILSNDLDMYLLENSMNSYELLEQIQEFQSC